MTEHEKQRCSQRALVLKALAHPTRLWMVEQLSTGERCVCEFVNEIDADFSTISRHLSVLKAAGIIADEKRGRQVIYRLVVPCILNFMNCVEAVLEERSRALTSAMKDKS